ncbi:MAG: hypothetical protein FWC99_07220 [Coriobacteriia bacterium]|nr:hypothetical protein [Coriobacteriia bacterium]
MEKSFVYKMICHVLIDMWQDDLARAEATARIISNNVFALVIHMSLSMFFFVATLARFEFLPTGLGTVGAAGVAVVGGVLTCVAYVFCSCRFISADKGVLLLSVVAPSALLLLIAIPPYAVSILTNALYSGEHVEGVAVLFIFLNASFLAVVSDIEHAIGGNMQILAILLLLSALCPSLFLWIGQIVRTRSNRTIQ